MPTWFRPAISSSARMPGSEAVLAKYAKKRGLCQCVSAGIRTSSRSRRTAANGSARSGGAAGSLRAELARLDLREHRQIAHALEIVRNPVERGGAVLAEAHFRSRSISDQGRVLRICSFVSQARRAWAMPSST